MTFHESIIDAEFNDGASELLSGWIAGDITNGDNIETIHGLCMKFKIGKDKTPLTEEQFFLCYKSAELLISQRIETEKTRAKPIFRRANQ